MRIFKNKKNKSKFISEGQPPEINSLGINKEYSYKLIIAIILAILAILGISLCVLDIRDNGLLFELSIGKSSVKYVGSSLGIIIVISSIIGILFQKPHVHLKK